MSKEQIEEMAKAKMLFFTTDGELAKYNGTDVEIIRPLTEKECDVEDVGIMYKARFYDGCERNVFEDELIDTEIKRIATKICSNFNDGICCVDCSVCILNCEYKLLAEHLYNAGYRKQSKGEWIDFYKGKYANPLYVCSVCEKGTLLRVEGNELGQPETVQALSSFCPNCGAKMKGGAE